MKSKTIALFMVLGFITGLVLGSSDFQYVGKQVDLDSRGNPVYQVDTGEIRMGYKVVGSGEPLLLLMGLGGTFKDWPQTVIDILSYEYRVILLDNRGMGYSTDTQKPFTYELLSEDVIRFMDAVQLDEAHMLGYSMGSMFIQHIIRYHPERINRAILHATAIDTSNVLESLKKNANAQLPESGPVRKQLDIVDDWHMDPESLSDFENEVLLLLGTSDKIVNPANSMALAGVFENSWLVRFKENTHYLLFENPVDFCKTVLLFLNHRR